MAALTLFTSVDIDGNVAASPSSSSLSSSSSPEIIQLYSNAVFNFLNGTIVNLAKPSHTAPRPANAAVVTGSSLSSASAATAAGTNTNDTIIMQQQQQQQFEGNVINDTNIATSMMNSRRRFSALSYQAVQTLGRDTDEENNNNGLGLSTYQQQQRQHHHLRPDLGVWDCHIDVLAAADDNTMTTIPRASTLLQQVVVGTKKKKTKTVLMTIDVTSNNIYMVQSIIEHMRDAILGAYTNDSSEVDRNVECNGMPSKTKTTTTTTTTSVPSSSSSYTTSMKSLQHSAFGKARITTVVDDIQLGGGGDGRDCNNNIALILAAIVPSSSSSSTSTTIGGGVDEYSERQSRALLSYHLRKFAFEVNCTLCFVSSDTKNNNMEEEETSVPSITTTSDDPMISGNSKSTMSVDELAYVVRRVAMGMSPIVIVEGGGGGVVVGNNEAILNSQQHHQSILSPSSIYPPGSHDAELVHGPYLRNASCEGRWDATVDDLDVALPPPTKTNTEMMVGINDDGGSGEGGGDEEWLSQLATSIGISTDAATVTTVGGPLSPLHRPPTTPTPSSRGVVLPAAGGGGKEKTSVPKKRVTRLSSTRNKDTKPKDEKEVMNFFDNLLKK